MTALKTQIVIVGGGVAGLSLAVRLGRKFRKQHFDIILLEKNRTHIWKPLLHEVAAGALDANLDEVGYRAHCHRWGYRYFNGSLQDIDRDKQEIVIAPLIDENGVELMSAHRIRYDYLVLALGSRTTDFAVPGVSEHCRFLDTRQQADSFRNALLDHCLRVSRRHLLGADAEEYVDIAVVGGGATGVELCAELFNAASGLRHYGLEVFDESRLRVTLIEAGERILPALPKEVADAARKSLEQLGVRILTGEKVTRATNEGFVTSGGNLLKAHLRLWAAGVKGPDILRNIGGLDTNSRDQLVVRPTLQTTRDQRIFALGDCASYTPEGHERPIPPRAQAAHQMSRTAYANLVALSADKELKVFKYRDRGSLVSLSRYSTVGSLMGNLVGGRMAVEGRMARLAYLSLYRMHLISVHGRLLGIMQIISAFVNKVTRPKMKLH